MMKNPTVLKIITNLSIDSKCFITKLPELKELSLAGDLIATFCIKNLGYNLPYQQSYCSQIDADYL
jgi:hypothetical protein